MEVRDLTFISMIMMEIILQLFLVLLLGALNGEQKWVDSVLKLMEGVDSYIELPKREVDKDFLNAC